MATIPADGKVVEGAPVVMATTATVVANPAPMPTEVPLAHVEGGIAQSAVDADGVAIVRSVKLEGRAFTDKKFAYFYGGCIGLFVILSIVLFAGQHDEYTFKGSDVTGVGEYHEKDAIACCDKAGMFYMLSMPCLVMVDNNQWSPDPSADWFGSGDDSTTATRRLATHPYFPSGFDFENNLWTAEALETAKSLGHRRMTAFDFKANRPYPKNVWEGFGLRPEIPLMLVVLIIACCVGFLKVMESFAQTLLFGTFAAEAIFALYLGIESGGWLFYVACLGIGVYVYCMKEKIKQAALVISHASTALLAMPSLMFTVFAWLIVSAILVVWIILVSAAAGKNSSIFETSYEGVEGATQCDFKQNPGVSQMQFVVYSIWNWLWFYANATQIFFIAGCVGTYHFEKEKVTAKMPLQFIKIALTTSFGTLGKLSLIFAFVDYIKKKSKFSCKKILFGWYDPVFWLAVIIRCCCLAFLNMMTKFCLIFHAFSGEEFWTSAKRTKSLMEKAGLGGLVLETAAMNCFAVIAYFLAVGMGFFCWWWMGVEYCKDVLGGKEGDWCGSSPEHAGMLRDLMQFLMFILMLSPQAAIVLVVLIAVIFGDNVWHVWVPWLCGIFVGGITHFFFTQTVQALLYASNTMFVAFAVDKATGYVDTSGNKLYAQIAEQISEQQQKQQELANGVVAIKNKNCCCC